MSTAEGNPIREQDLPPGPRLNLAIGPNCPVRCAGCYNHFGNSFSAGGLVAADEIISFATDVRDRDIDGATLSGGDPLFHPEIKDILLGLHDLGFRTKLDTVGTALLEDSRIVFKGRGTVPQIQIDDIKDTLESVTLPLDGADQETVQQFRKGRKNLLQETLAVADLLVSAGVTLEFNTVVSSCNMNQLNEVEKIAEDAGAKTWHIFEYDPSGPNPSSRKEALSLKSGEYAAAVSQIGQFSTGGMQNVVRAQDSRVGEGAYFFISDTGNAWCPTGDADTPIRYGHITKDRRNVLVAYDRYLRVFGNKFEKSAE